VYAGSYDEDFQRHYDLVAIVKVDSKSDEYEGAYNITIERVIFRYGEENEKKDKSTKVKTGDKLILVENKIRKIEKLDKDQPKTKKIQSIRQDGCNFTRVYSVGTRLRLFSVEIEPGFYKNNACRLTTTLNENT